MPVELISDAELTGIRTDAEQLFVDECIIDRLIDRAIFSREAGEIVGTDDYDTIYEGECSIYSIQARRDRFDEFGQGLIYTRQYRVILPWDEVGVQIRDRYITTVSADPQLVGRPMEVRDVVVGTILGYRRITVHDSKE